MAFTIGQELRNGIYTIERELGRGKVAVTYLAQQHKGERTVISSSVEYLHFGEKKAEGRRQRAEGKKESCKGEGNYK
ncbi:MAG: hypothetical protein F6J86_05280 [Symploca sp. SIO1B1]|nr:hypothetical protein [Symploca sp. SIO1B1]